MNPIARVVGAFSSTFSLHIDCDWSSIRMFWYFYRHDPVLHLSGNIANISVAWELHATLEAPLEMVHVGATGIVVPLVVAVIRVGVRFGVVACDSKEAIVYLDCDIVFRMAWNSSMDDLCPVLGLVDLKLVEAIVVYKLMVREEE